MNAFYRSADRKGMEISILGFVFAVVVGYFAGRMKGILERSDR